MRPQALSKGHEAIVIQIVARDVVVGVEMARSLGYPMPKDFNVGFQITNCEDLKTGQKTRITLRLDDVTYNSILLLPYLNGLHSMPMVDRLMNEAMNRLRSDAHTLAHIWLSKHDVYKTMPSDKLQAALAKLDILSREDRSAVKWNAEISERVKRFKYEVKR